MDFESRLSELELKITKIEEVIYNLEKTLSKTNEVVQINVSNSDLALKYINQLLEMYKTLSMQFVNIADAGTNNTISNNRTMKDVMILFDAIVQIRNILGLESAELAKKMLDDDKPSLEDIK